MKTLIFCAKGFETMEFSVFIDVLGWARNDYGVNVQVDTCGFTKKVVSTFHVPILVDKTIEEVVADEYDALAIPGGFEEFGFYEEAYDERFLQLIREFDSRKKIIASICVGALPLGKSGILNGRRATTYHLRDAYRQKQLAEFGVNVVNEPVVIDDNIITSYCPQTAPEVAFELLGRLTDTRCMEIVKKAMGYQSKRVNGIFEIQREDIPECAEVIKTSFRTVAAEFGITQNNAPNYVAFATTVQKLEQQMEEGRPMFAWFDDKQRIVGYYSLAKLEDYGCELNNLCVLPEYRHQKIGEKLLQAAYRQAEQTGYPKMLIGIVEENLKLRKWYEKYGAIHMGTQKFDFFPFTCGYLEKRFVK